MPTLGGKYKVPHFDAKGEGDALFAASGVPVTYLLTSFYWDNLVSFGMGPKPGPDGTLIFTLPMGNARLAGIAAQGHRRMRLRRVQARRPSSSASAWASAAGSSPATRWPRR